MMSPGLVGRIKSTGGHSTQRGILPHHPHHLLGESDVPYGVALIIVQTALHGHHWLARQHTEHDDLCGPATVLVLKLGIS